MMQEEVNLKIILVLEEQQKIKKYFTLQSTQRIKPNQEIHADYGRDYWPREYYKNFFFEKNGRKEDKFI